jgi:hypothetical protein
LSSRLPAVTLSAFSHPAALVAPGSGINQRFPSSGSSATGGDFGELGALREYWPEETVLSSDGLFAMKVRRAKKMTFSNLIDEEHNDDHNLVLRISNPID